MNLKLVIVWSDRIFREGAGNSARGGRAPHPRQKNGGQEKLERGHKSYRDFIF
jgi:hypothetical protein